jgi:hypothetical protein
VSALRHGAVRENDVFSGRNVQLGLTHPEKPAYSRMIMENQKGFARHRSWQIQPAIFVQLLSTKTRHFVDKLSFPDLG